MTKATKMKETEASLFPDQQAAQQQAKAAPVKEVNKSAAPKVAPPKKRQEVAKAGKTGTAVSTVVVEQRPGNLLAAVMHAVADPKGDAAKMHSLLDARDRLMQQEAEVQFWAAYIAMQEEIPIIDAKGRIEIPAKEGSRNKRDQSTPYATYNEINRVTKPILGKHKFGMMMLPEPGVGGVGVVMRGKLAYVCETTYGRMVHVEQCSIAAPLETSGSKNNVQGVGSSLSYTKRYCAINLLNIVSHAAEDRDLDGHDPEKVAKAEEKKAAAVQPISAEQLKTLRETMKDCGVEDALIKQKYKIKRTEDLPAGNYAEAIESCQNWKKAHS